MAPVQMKIISVGEKHIDYCNKLKQEFLDLDLRPEIDIDNETVANKIRKAVGEKVPYIIVIGDKEIESNNLSIRKRGQQKIEVINKKEFIDNLFQEIEDKK